jgi:hypothetical protein
MNIQSELRIVMHHSSKYFYLLFSFLFGCDFIELKQAEFLPIEELTCSSEEVDGVWTTKINWSEPSTVEVNYEIWRWEIHGEWELVASIESGTHEWLEGYPIEPVWLSQTAYRVVSSWQAESLVSANVWGSNQIPGNNLNYVYTASGPWNSAFQVPDSMEDWQPGDQISVEEVALVGGNVVPFWSHKLSVVDGTKNLQELEHMKLARELAATADVPLRFFVETRPDVYGEYTGEKAIGFDDDWLLQVPRQETCETLLDIHERGYKIIFAQHNNLDFWMRIWSENIDTSSEEWLFVSESCDGDSPAPIFYGKWISEDTFSLNYVLTDLRKPDFIDWHTNWARDLVQLLQPEGVFFPVKSAWESFASEEDRDLAKLTLADGRELPMWECDSYRPSLLSHSIDYEIHSPLSACAPYEEDEFELGLRNWVHAFHQKSPDTVVATNENPAKGGEAGKLSWIGDEVSLREVVIGELYLGDPLESFYSQVE